MKVFFAENAISDILEFLQYIQQLGWRSLTFPSQMDDSADINQIRHFLRSVCEERPDIVILDAALTKKEEELVDRLRLGVEEISGDSLSGFKYCQALASERFGIPIIFFTNYPEGPVARTAMRVGADRVIWKQTKNEDLANEIKELVNSKTPNDSVFYWSMRENMEACHDMWKGESLRKALDRFFLKSPNARRFGLFTASLRSILSPLFQGNLEAEKKLMLNLVKTQVLLSVVDPRLRDHVKHTGNVFWLGYRLLHDIEEFHDPQSLPGSLPGLYDGSGPLPAREQVLLAWTLAALFHDCGYIDERQSMLKELVASLLPSASLATKNVREEPTWNKNIRLLRDFVSNFLSDDHFLYHLIDTVVTSFGANMKCQGASNENAKLLDHGFLSAHRLMDMIPLDLLDDQKRNIVLHAALAVALHNSPEMLRKWEFEDKCKGQLPLGAFPVCSLLTFCDTVQTWDRELDADPAVRRTETYDGLIERLVLTDTAYISGSELCEFSINHREDNSGYNLKIRLRYFVDAAGDIMKVCEKLGDDIQRWIDSEKLLYVCKMMGMSPMLDGRVIYELPMLSGTREAPF